MLLMKMVKTDGFSIQTCQPSPETEQSFSQLSGSGTCYSFTNDMQIPRYRYKGYI